MGLPRSKVGDHPCGALVTGSRVALSLLVPHHQIDPGGSSLGCLQVLPLRLHADRPDEARQLSCDRDTGLVGLQATRIQCCKSLSQPQLRRPTHSSYGFGQLLLSHLCPSADACLEAIVPGDLGQKSPCVRVARFGDAASARALAAGVLGRY